MIRMKCRQCGSEITSEFGAKLSFCNNCGAAINSISAGDEIGRDPKGRFFPGLVLGAGLTLFLGGAAYLLTIYLTSSVSTTGAPSAKSSPWIRLPGSNSVSASEITQVVFSERSHAGPLVGSDESYTTSGATSFSSDGAAIKTTGAKIYDTGKKQGSGGQRYQAVISTDQFQRLAQVLVDNDFSKLGDSPDRITDTREYRLIVTYSGTTKTILTSNIGKDTDEVKAILDAFESLQSQVEWKLTN